MRLLVGGIVIATIILGTYAPTVYAIGNSPRSACDTNGVTVVYINGVFTTKDEAESDKDNIEIVFRKRSKRKNITFIKAYNPSHLAGIGDMIKSAEQAYIGAKDKSINDFDLQTILNNIHKNVTTQKILLVGHSQGTFYTNSVYQYLIKHGIPKSAITVYNIATPASFVAGSGLYTTSSTDSVINAVREAVTLGRAQAPLPPNITFNLTKKEQGGQWPGHALSAIYLKYADVRIVNAMTKDVRSLVSKEVPKNATGGCFTDSSKGIRYKAKQLTFRILDPAIALTKKSVGASLYLALLPERAVVVGIQSSFGFLHTKKSNPITYAPAPNKKTIIKTVVTKIISPTQNNKIKKVVAKLRVVPTPTPNLSDIQRKLNNASTLLALLQKQITVLNKKREAKCIANSLQGPWDKVGWVGDKPGCDDKTPGVQKMFWAPIQGVGGGATVVAISGSINGNPQTGFFGTTQIEWTTSGATTCTVIGGVDSWNGLSGNKTTSILIDITTYTLSCDNGAFTKTTTVAGIPGGLN